MVQAKMEERIAALEKQIAELKTQVAALIPATDWRSVVNKFAGDEDLQRIFEAGRKIREEDRRRTKPKPSKSKQRARS